MIASALRALAVHGKPVLAVGLLAGITVPPLAALLRPALPVMVVLILGLALVRIDWGELVTHVRRPLLLGAVVVWFLLVSPLVVWLVVAVLDVPAGLAGGLVLMAAAPTLMAGPAFALLMGLDASLSLLTMILSTLVAPLTIPLVAVELLGLELAIDAFGLMARLAALIGASLVLGILGRRALGAARIKRRGAEIDGITVVGLVVFGVAIMDGVAARLLAEPLDIAVMVAVAFAANVGLQVLGAGVFAGTGPFTGLSIGFATGNRNMGLLYAVLPAGAHPDTPLFFAIGQLPMYMLPAILAPLYGRLLKRRGEDGGWRAPRP